jgi:hypothetical protein
MKQRIIIDKYGVFIINNDNGNITTEFYKGQKTLKDYTIN